MVDWSYSTARLYASCPRAFFYRQQDHTAADRSTPEQAGASDPLYVSSPGALVGTAVHRGISQQIDRWRQGASPSMHAAQATATAVIDTYSDATSDTEPDSDPAAHGISVSDQLATSLARVARSHLQTFFQVVWPRFTAHRYITHETSMSFSVAGHPVWVRPDLCTRDTSGDLVITDWKTADIDPHDQSLQLRVYALWAHRHYEPEIDRIRAQRVYTRTGEFDQISVTQSTLDTLQDRIAADCRDWNARTDCADFPADPEAEKCHQCPYLEHCAAGQRVTSSEST